MGRTSTICLSNLCHSSFSSPLHETTQREHSRNSGTPETTATKAHILLEKKALQSFTTNRMTSKLSAEEVEGTPVTVILPTFVTKDDLPVPPPPPSTPELPQTSAFEEGKADAKKFKVFQNPDVKVIGVLTEEGVLVQASEEETPYKSFEVQPEVTYKPFESQLEVKENERMYSAKEWEAEQLKTPPAKKRNTTKPPKAPKKRKYSPGYPLSKRLKK